VTKNASDALTQFIEIDVADWALDDLYSNYPEGARSKKAIFPPADIDLDFIIPSRRYLFKKSAKRYPDQYWGEIVAYQVGHTLGVTVPPAFAAFDSTTNICGALIEWFYEDGKAIFVPGGNYLQAIDPDYDRKRGDQHNFRDVQVFARLFSRHKKEANDVWQKYWGTAFLFDALIGNTDRHQDNWGYLWIASQAGTGVAQLSPLFDNGTSLGHERFPDRIKIWQEADFERYIAKGTHHMKWKENDAFKCGHFAMIEKMTSAFPSIKPTLLQMIREFSIEALRCKLEFLQNLNLPVPLTKERADFYLKLISLRKRKIELALS
jgi:HipA-like C-terminal domain